MIEKGKLVNGNFYFQVYNNTIKSYVPEIRTFFYLGVNIYNHRKQKCEDKYYFQDAESFEKKGNILEKGKHLDFNMFYLKEKHLVTMFDIDGLIAELNEIKKMKDFKGETIFIPYSKVRKKKRSG